MTSQDSLQAIAENVRQETGHVDLVVANAGMAGPGLMGLGPRASATEFARTAWATPMPDFDAVYQLNCTATYYTILAFLPLLEAANNRRDSTAARASSQVVVTSSMVAFQRDPRYGFAYLSSKAALVSMVKSFATHAVSWGIRFNTIAAGRKSSLPPPSSFAEVRQLMPPLSPLSLPDRHVCTSSGTIQDRQGQGSHRGGCLLSFIPSSPTRWVQG